MHPQVQFVSWMWLHFAHGCLVESVADASGVSASVTVRVFGLALLRLLPVGGVMACILAAFARVLA